MSPKTPRAAVLTLPIVWLAFVMPAVQAQPPSPPAVGSTDPPDQLGDAIDPWNPGGQRTAFLAAAGVDLELNEAEFGADANAPAPRRFARSFDRWAALSGFDKNTNGSIDWFEARAYREDQRRRVLEHCDADRNQRLTGAERDKALALLGGARIKGDPDRAAPSRKDDDADPAAAALHDETDDAGDGARQPDSREDRLERWRQRMLEQFDADGDGQLDQAERQVALETMRARARQSPGAAFGRAFRDWAQVQFDVDGDGTLNDAERQTARDFGRAFREIGRDWRTSGYDTDGDGALSRDERRAMRRDRQQAWLTLRGRMQAWADRDGDDTVSDEERDAFAQRVEESVARRMVGYGRAYDADSDGVLDADERRAMIEGLDADYDRRAGVHDIDGDGRLDASEAADVMESYWRDLGILDPDPGP